MEIKQFRLSHLGRFRSLEVPLAPTPQVQSNVTVFIGNNGAGKTSILKGLATSLSWFVARLRSEKGSGSPIPEEVILNGATSAAIDIEVVDDQGQSANPGADESDALYQWTLARTHKGKKANLSASFRTPPGWPTTTAAC
ncbi:AAA family ATPase [Zobellella maritima]|uniref:AAA family ATPase n=1 Tax=Zobellella maritima TaxID=2059725 RepID=UPI0018E5629B|nr:AAA family ATPase [Zobellella maritima]